MKDNRTISVFTDSIDQEYSWRIKELSNYRNVLLSSKNEVQKSLIRGGVILLYAHWEGFVKEAANHYYNFVTRQKHLLNELKENFTAIALRKELTLLNETRKITLQIKSLEIIKNNLNIRAKFPSRIPIKTSNLNFDMFIEYCCILGLDIKKFELKKNFIDVKLVENRHKIAHGNYLLVDAKDFKDIYDFTITLLYEVKTELLNSAILMNYRN